MRPEGEPPLRYQVERALGSRSGVSTLYAATDLRGREVVLRVFTAELSADREFRAEFARTARIHAGLEHPNVVRLLDFSSDHNRQDGGPALFIALERVAGATLAERIEFAPLPLGPTLRMAALVAKALHAAARAGVQHRRLGTEAIMLDDDDVERPVLTDFGVGWSVEGPVPRPDPGALLGPAGALTPEAIRGAAPDARSAVYALGAIVYECLAGVAPFDGATRAELLHAHLAEPPPRLAERAPHIPEAVGEVLVRAMAKAPGERPSEPLALVEELERVKGR